MTKRHHDQSYMAETIVLEQERLGNNHFMQSMDGMMSILFMGEPMLITMALCIAMLAMLNPVNSTKTQNHLRVELVMIAMIPLSQQRFLL